MLVFSNETFNQKIKKTETKTTKQKSNKNTTRWRNALLSQHILAYSQEKNAGHEVRQKSARETLEQIQ